MTWQEIIEIEPRLKELYDQAKAVRDRKGSKYFCANEVWYCRFKPRLLRLAGWQAAREELRTVEAYDTAYDRLYSPLPPCRNCGCF